MALKARLDLRQSQSLVMTPQLQQAIKLLQFNNIELSNFIDSELMENPLLERADPGQTYAEAGDGAVGNGDEGLDSRSNDNFTDRDDRFGTDRLTSSETMGSDDGPLDVSSDALYGGEGEITRNGEPVSGSHDYSAPYSGGPVAVPAVRPQVGMTFRGWNRRWPMKRHCARPLMISLISPLPMPCRV